MRDTDAEHRSRFTVWRPIGLGGFLYRTIRSCLACFGRSLKWGQGGRGSDTIYFDQPIYNGAISPYSLARPFSLQLVPHPPPLRRCCCGRNPQRIAQAQAPRQARGVHPQADDERDQTQQHGERDGPSVAQRETFGSR